MYAVVFWHDRNNRIYDVLSTHRTLSGAERQFRRNNPWLFNKRWAERHGMHHCGTFEEVVELDEHGEPQPPEHYWDKGGEW